ncbi:sphingomyelin phosphodiesterase [Leptospira kirschneri]|uniref:sphingomyelin phosphodiesterase n=1 Tax=Leptospira kirschneri TaxID=29507 RepID=UPI0002DF1E44|nr:sphingomyelin phosphodiesterase [Leptospira kirschneri]KON76017.1 Sphingomyelin phosphodiesterase [Leptospira kirschneri serovar Mozdok]KPZ75290.1 phosphodiesterase [Leptospira kirschneri serovar Mozdok]
MKTMRNVLRKKEEKKFKNWRFITFFFIFLFNCLPDKESEYNNLLMYNFLTPKSQNIESPNHSSKRIIEEVDNEEINVLTYNLFLYTEEHYDWGDWEQEKRAELLANSKFVNNQDIVVFEGIFHDNARKILLDKLQSQYPDQTDVIGRTKDGWNDTQGSFRQHSSFNNGGVVILSKWPILEKIQYIFNNHGCGSDTQYNKGFAYVKIKKKDRIIHILGTDTQSHNDECIDKGENARADQFTEMRKFINLKRIPQNETVMIVGSLNVNKEDKVYYNSMLYTLEADNPHYAGIPFTWDPKKNALTAFINSNKKSQQYTEYILLSKNHSQPPVWQNLAYDPISPTTWKRKSDGYTNYEFSDHYPVYGFDYADPSTPTQSGHRRKYDNVMILDSAYHRIQASPTRPDGWLIAEENSNYYQGQPTRSEFARFNLLQEDDLYSNPDCISGRGKIRIESSEYRNYFWTYWLRGGGGNYAYYPKFNDGSKKFEIEVPLDRCIESGIFWLRDYDILTNDYYYLESWRMGHWMHYIYLWDKIAHNASKFRVLLDQTPERNWGEDLIYR